MNRKKLRKLQAEIESLRGRGGVSAEEIARILRALGRVQDGKVWRSEEFPNLRPITVHDHPGDMNRHTKNGILEDMDEDVMAWETVLEDGDQ